MQQDKFSGLSNSSINGMKKGPSISVIVLSTRKKELENCIESISKAIKYSKKYYDFYHEITMIGDKRIFGNRDINFIYCEEKNISKRRNIGILKAKYEFICFIDDDVIVPVKFFLNFFEIECNFDSNIFSGPDITYNPLILVEKIQERLFSNVFFNGYNKKILMYNTDIPVNLSPRHFSFTNVFIKKNVFEKVGMLDENFPHCEDTYFFNEISKVNEKCIFSNKLFVKHHRKKNLFSLMKQMFNFGKYNTILFLKEFIK